MAIKVARGTKTFTKAVSGAYVSDKAASVTIKEGLPSSKKGKAIMNRAIKKGVKAISRLIDEQVLTQTVNSMEAGDVVVHTSKAVSDNPKNIAGSSRVDVTLIPPIALLHCADAMMDGADKYDPYNWRAKKIAMRGYIAAIFRHALAVLEGEDIAHDSLTKHLGHIMASAAIVLDAQAHGCLIDDSLSLDGGMALAAARRTVEANVRVRREARARKQSS